jgi:hypothetical protein
MVALLLGDSILVMVHTPCGASDLGTFCQTKGMRSERQPDIEWSLFKHVWIFSIVLLFEDDHRRPASSILHSPSRHDI